MRLLRRKSELEVRGKSGAVSIDGLVQTPGAHGVERSEIRVKNHALAAKVMNLARDILGSQRVRYPSSLSILAHTDA